MNWKSYSTDNESTIACPFAIKDNSTTPTFNVTQPDHGAEVITVSSHGIFDFSYENINSPSKYL